MGMDQDTRARIGIDFRAGGIALSAAESVISVTAYWFSLLAVWRGPLLKSMRDVELVSFPRGDGITATGSDGPAGIPGPCLQRRGAIGSFREAVKLERREFTRDLKQ
jgi:hypothetical protein